MSAVTQTNAAPFDRIANVYDDIFSNSRIGLVQRKAVWAELDRTFRPGESILEINCGTGVDALHLASRGVHVDACDAATKMIARAQESVETSGLSDIRFWCMPIEQIDAFRPNRPYDGVFSNFSGLNCVAELGPVARGLARLVRPRGQLIVCVFGVFCLWELVWYLRSWNLTKAFRRFSRQGIRSAIAPGAAVTVHYRSSRSLKRVFAPYFRLERLRGVGVAVPPSYAESFATRFPRLFRAACAVDPMLGRSPVLRSMADHVVLTFRRTESPL